MLCFKSGGRCSIKMKLSFENSFLNIIFVPFQSSSENNLRRYMKTCSICKQHEKKTHKTCVQNFTKLFCCVEAIRGIFAKTFPRICGQFLKCPRCLDQLSHLWNVFQKMFFLLNKEMSEQKKCKFVIFEDFFCEMKVYIMLLFVAL